MPANTTQSPAMAGDGTGDYALHREGVASADTIADVPKTNGMNMAGYEHAHIRVLPEGGADPAVEVYWWSNRAEAWVQEHTPLSRAGVGADTPYEFTVQCRGRRMLVAVTTIAAGTVDVEVAGFRTVVQPVG